MKPRTLDAESLDILERSYKRAKDQPRILLVAEEREREEGEGKGRTWDEC